MSKQTNFFHLFHPVDEHLRTWLWIRFWNSAAIHIPDQSRTWFAKVYRPVSRIEVQLENTLYNEFEAKKEQQWDAMI